MARSMDWILENNIVDGLFFCATLTGRRRDHTASVQAVALTSDSGAEAVKQNPRCSRGVHSRRVGAAVGMKVRSLVGLFNHSAFHWLSFQNASRMLLFS